MSSYGLQPEEAEKIRDQVMAETEKSFKTSSRLKKLRRELDAIAFSDMQDYVRIDDQGGVRVIPLPELKSRRSGAIRKIRERKKVLAGGKDGENQIIETHLEYELYDKMEGIKELVDIMGIKAPSKVNLGGQVIILRPEEIEKPDSSGT